MTVETRDREGVPVRPTEGRTGAKGGARSRQPGGLASAAVWLPVAGFAAWAGARALGIERGMRPVQLMAFTPYVAAASVVPVAVALGRRRWVAAGTAAVAAATLAACVLPRSVSDGGGPPVHAGWPTLRVLTSNILGTAADPEALVAFVRERNVDILAVQELTWSAEVALDRAGLAELLPYRNTNPQPGASGTGLYSRYPLDDPTDHKLGASGFVQSAATVTVPGAVPVELESVHPCAPVEPGRDLVWRSDLGEQVAATPDGVVRILLGDFNATLDHAALRGLIATGYRDAASVAGAGFVPTWPNDGQLIPGVTIDHVLADRRVGIGAVSVHDVPGSDHRAILAELALPPA